MLQTVIRTRSGYDLKDVLREFKFTLEQPGATFAAKSLHYTAELIASGCLMAWKRFMWDFVFDHVGIGSPRVFMFLQKQFSTIENQWNRYDHEQCVQDPAFQKLCTESVLIVRSCPRKPQLKVPRVPAETHTEDWISKSTGSAPSSSILARVFKLSHDSSTLKRVGEEFCKSIVEGQTEKALFWMKWTFEEDAKLRKQHQGHGLSTLERGPSNLSGKQRTSMAFFYVYLLAELYKELAGKGLIRMTEEVQALLNLVLMPDTAMTTKRKTDCLMLVLQILCEVPRWKVPAAPGLVTDMTQFKRAVDHSEHFFREVLAYVAPKGDLEQAAKKLKKTELQSKKLDMKKEKLKSLNSHLDAYDKAMADWMGGGR